MARREKRSVLSSVSLVRVQVGSDSDSDSEEQQNIHSKSCFSAGGNCAFPFPFPWAVEVGIGGMEMGMGAGVGVGVGTASGHCNREGPCLTPGQGHYNRNTRKAAVAVAHGKVLVQVEDKSISEMTASNASSRRIGILLGPNGT